MSAPKFSRTGISQRGRRGWSWAYTVHLVEGPVSEPSTGNYDREPVVRSLCGRAGVAEKIPDLGDDVCGACERVLEARKAKAS